MNKKISYTRYEPENSQRLIPLFLIIFIDSFGYFLVIPVLLRLFLNHYYALIPSTISMHARDILYGIAIALSPFAFIISAPIIGHLSDKYGRKKVLTYSLVGALFGFLLPVIGIITGRLSLLLMGRFITGASSSSQPVAQAAIADFSTGKRKAFYLSLIAFAMTLAMVLGPLAGGYLSDSTIVSWFNVTTPYWAGVIIALINIILLLIFFNDGMQLKTTSSKLMIIDKFKRMFRIIIKNKIGGLLFIMLLLEASWSQYYQSIFLFLTHRYHYAPDKIGLFTGYIGLWMCIGLTIIYKILIRYFSLEKILYSSLFIAAISLLCCNYTVNSLFEWIFVIPTSIFVGTSYASLIAVLSNQTSPDHQGLALGMAGTMLGLAWMSTGFMSGILINWYLPLPLMIAALLMIVGFSFAYFKFKSITV